MLTNLLITVLGLLAALTLSTHNGGVAVLLLCVAAGTTYARREYNHTLSKQLEFWAGRLAQVLAGILPVVILGSFLAGATPEQVEYFTFALAISLLPVAVPFVIRGKLAVSESKLAQHHTIKIMRSVLTTNAALVSLVLLSLAGLAWLHIAPVIALPQLLLAGLALILPLSTLKHDPEHHKLLQVTAHNLHGHTLSLKAGKSYAGFGLLTALFSYASYLLVFTENRLSPRYIDTSLPLHHQAATTAFLALVFCLYAAILFERVDQHDRFFTPYLTANKKLLRAFGLSLAVLVAIIYTPGVHSLFQASPLSVFDWLTVFFATGLYIGARLLQRHTRLHTRRALLQLHQELEKPLS